MREEWLKVIREGSMPGGRCVCVWGGWWGGDGDDDDGREVRVSIKEWGLIWTLAGYIWTVRCGVNERERKMNGCNIKYKRVKELRSQKKKRRNEWRHHRKRQKAKNKERKEENKEKKNEKWGKDD